MSEKKEFRNGHLEGRMYVGGLGGPFAIIKCTGDSGGHSELWLFDRDDILALASLASEMALLVEDDRTEG